MMTTNTSPSVINLNNQHRPKKAKTDAERARASRARKKARALLAIQAVTPVAPVEDCSTRADHEGAISKILPTGTVTPLPPPTVTLARVTASRSSRRSAASIILMAAALGLAAVGICMNAWYARSLGASEVAGVLFTAVGVAADIVALVMPSVAAMAWQGKQRGAALAGWAIWAVTFCFAVTAGIGFASVNITDVTAARAARLTPAVLAAQTALADAMASRNRECKTGTGRYCREREASVVDRRQALDAAMASVAGTADPQTATAVKLVSWVSLGAVHPTGDDFSMLRLMLLALLPQLGGLLLMAGGSK